MFGDNDNAKYRTGIGNPGGSGQAQITRPAGKSPYDRLPESGGINGNAIGITTTFYGGYTPDINEFKILMNKEFEPIETWVKKGGSIVTPCNSQGKHSLGTGIAGLGNKIPGAIEYIQSKVDELVRLGKQPAERSSPLDFERLKQDLHQALSRECQSYESSRNLKSYLSIKQSLAQQQPEQSRAKTDSRKGEVKVEKSQVSSPDHQPMEVDQDAADRKRSHSGEDEESTAQRGRISILERPKEHPASGLKHTLHGNVYQLKLLMLFLKRGLDKKYSFRLATEMDAAEKFDDLVFQYENERKDGIVYRFLQAKHKQDESKKITVNDLLTEKDGEFSLQKYFISYRKIKQNSEFQGRNDELKDFVICTNINFKFGDSKGDLKLSEDIFDKEVDEEGKEKIDDILKTALLRFKDNFSGKEQIVSILKGTSDLAKLAKKLAECVLDSKPIDQDRSKNDPEGNLFKSYQGALIKEVINSKSKKLRIDFLNGVNLSPEARNFRDAFEEVFNGRRKSFRLDDNSNIKKEDLGNFAKEVAALIVKGQADKAAKITRHKQVIKDNFDKLAGYVLVKENDKTVHFSSAFLSNNQLPGNLNDFRTQLKNELSKKGVVFSSLNQYRFEVYKEFKTCEEIYVDKNTFWKKMREKELKLFNNFGEISTNLESIEKFAEKIANLLEESRSKEEKVVKVKRKDNIIAN